MTDATDGQRERFVEGDLLRPLLALSAPLVAIELLQTLYNAADTFWVGRLGPDAVSALSFGWALQFFLIAVSAGLTMGGTVLVSQHTGAGNEGRVGHVAGQTLAFVTVVAATLAVAGAYFTPALLAFLGAEPGTAVHGMATAYTRVVVLGAPFTFGFFVFQALLRGWGDSTTPLYLMVASVALNLALDPVFIFGFQGNPLLAWVGLDSLQASLYAATGFAGWGVTGAAAATVLARGLAAAAGVWLLTTGRVGFRVGLADLRPRLATVRKIVAIGAPVAGEHGAQAVAISAMTALVAFVGTDAVAAYGIGGRLSTMVWLPVIGLGRGVDTVVAQNLGAGERRRARRTVVLAIAIVVTALLAVGGVAVALAEPLVGAFVTGEGSVAVVAHGVDYVRIVAPALAFMGAFHMLNGAFHGAGSTRLSMALAVTARWGVQTAVGLALVLVFDLGATGVWIAVAASFVTAGLAAAGCFVLVDWDREVIDEGDADESDVGADEGGDAPTPSD